MIAIDFYKHPALNDDQIATQQNNFTGNLDQDRNTAKFFIIKEAKETILDFSKETVRVLWIYFVLM